MKIKAGTKFWRSEVGEKNFLYASSTQFFLADKDVVISETSSILKSGDKKVPVNIGTSSEIFWLDEQVFSYFKKLSQ
jgi:hypothetical protein